MSKFVSLAHEQVWASVDRCCVGPDGQRNCCRSVADNALFRKTTAWANERERRRDRQLADREAEIEVAALDSTSLWRAPHVGLAQSVSPARPACVSYS